MFIPFSPVTQVHVHSDASGSFGCGALLNQSSWFQLRWPHSWDSIDITTKELLPVVLAAAVRGREWRHQSVCFHTDNMGVVAILQKRSARHPVSLHLLRCLYFYAAFFRFDYVAHHVPGMVNVATGKLIPESRPFFSKWSSTSHNRKFTLVCDKALK